MCWRAPVLSGPAGKRHPVGAGDYLYTPAGTGMEFCCTGEEPMRAILYKQRYIPAEGVGGAADLLRQ